MYIIYKNRKFRGKKIWKYRNIGKIQKLQVTESKNYSEYTIQKNRNYNYENSVLCQPVALFFFLSISSLEITLKDLRFSYGIFCSPHT